jgi:hypothetical protein
MAQKLVDDAIVRYHKILDSQPHANLEWTDALTERMRGHGMVVGTRLASPFLRPHFVSRKQYDTLVRAGQALQSAIERLETMALATPALLQRMELLPAERMLASIDPGYSFLHVTSLLNSVVQNGSLHFQNYQASSAMGLAYGELLADMFYDAAPVKEFRKKHTLTKFGGTKNLLSAILKAYKAYGGKNKPNIAVLEFKQPFQTVDAAEYMVLVELLRKHGYSAELVNPEQLDYRNGTLSKGDYAIDLLYRASSLQEFLLRFDLNHPLVKAYRDGKVCIVNSFRAELAQKRAMFSLLTDDQVTGKFPAVERKAIQSYIPWTRIVSQAKTVKDGETIDLPAYISANKDQLVLVPNDATGALPIFDGPQTEQSAWDRALKQALRERYVVQDRVEAVTAKFPVLFYGSMEMREMKVDVHPHMFLGEVKSCTAHLTAANSGFSTMEGVAATFLLEGK